MIEEKPYVLSKEYEYERIWIGVVKEVQATTLGLNAIFIFSSIYAEFMDLCLT